MKNRMIFIFMFLGLLLFSGCDNVEYIDKSKYSIVVLPDTQRYTGQTHGASVGTYYKMMEWIVDNKDDYNIKYVLHVGDVVEFGNKINQWEFARHGFDYLDNNSIPYLIGIGNHDMDAPDTPPNRTITTFNTYFNQSKNDYKEFRVSGEKWILYSLPFQPTQVERELLDQTLYEHSDKRFMIINHAWLLGINAGRDGGANEVWNTILMKHNNVRFIFGGHFTEYGEFDVQTEKNINQLFLNWQKYPSVDSTDNGYFLVLVFNPSEKHVDIKMVDCKQNQTIQKSSVKYI